MLLLKMLNISIMLPINTVKNLSTTVGLEKPKLAKSKLMAENNFIKLMERLTN